MGGWVGLLRWTLKGKGGSEETVEVGPFDHGVHLFKARLWLHAGKWDSKFLSVREAEVWWELLEFLGVMLPPELQSD